MVREERERKWRKIGKKRGRAKDSKREGRHII